MSQHAAETCPTSGIQRTVRICRSTRHLTRRRMAALLALAPVGLIAVGLCDGEAP